MMDVLYAILVMIFKTKNVFITLMVDKKYNENGCILCYDDNSNIIFN